MQQAYEEHKNSQEELIGHARTKFLQIEDNTGTCLGTVQSLVSQVESRVAQVEHMLQKIDGLAEGDAEAIRKSLAEGKLRGTIRNQKDIGSRLHVECKKRDPRKRRPSTFQ